MGILMMSCFSSLGLERFLYLAMYAGIEPYIEKFANSIEDNFNTEIISGQLCVFLEFA